MMRSRSWLTGLASAMPSQRAWVSQLACSGRYVAHRIKISLRNFSWPSSSHASRKSSDLRPIVRLSRIFRFLSTVELTKIRPVVYGVDEGHLSGKGTELPGCWTSNGFSCPRFLGVLRHVQCLATITRCVGEFAAWALLGHLSDPPERSVVAVRAASIRTHCRLPFDPPALSTPMQRIAR